MADGISTVHIKAQPCGAQEGRDEAWCGPCHLRSDMHSRVGSILVAHFKNSRRPPPKKNSRSPEFPSGSVGQGSGIVTAVALVTSAAVFQSLAWELPHAAGEAKKKFQKANHRE